MSSEKNEESGGNGRSDTGDDSARADSVDGLLADLLGDSPKVVPASPSNSEATAPRQSGSGSDAEGPTESSELEDGIVSSLLDELLAAVPGSTDAEFTEAATAVPFADSPGQSSQPDSPADKTQAESADVTGVTDNRLRDDANLLTDTDQSADAPADLAAALDGTGSEDPTAALDELLNSQPDIADAPADDHTDIGSEDPTVALDELLNDQESDDAEPSVDESAGTDEQSTGSEDPTALLDDLLDDESPTDDDADGEHVSDSSEESTDATPESEGDDEATEIMAVDATEVMTPAPDAGTIVDTTSDESPAPAEAEAVPPAARQVERDRSTGGGRRVLTALALCAVGLLLLLGGAWAIDMATHQGEVLRGTTLAGESIQGLSDSDLQELLDERTQELAGESLDVEIGDVTVSSDPVTLGVSLDRSTMIDEALGAGRQGFFLFRPFSWLGRFFSSEDIAERYAYDATTTTDAAKTILLAPLAKVKEPELSYSGSNVSVVPGAVGTTIDPTELVDRLPSVMDGGVPYGVALSAIDDSPSLTDDQVRAVADEINSSTSEAVALRVLDDVAVVETNQLREWSQLDNNGDGEASWSLNSELALNELQPLFPSLGSEDQQAKFVVVDEEPRIIPASETVICCDEDSAERIRAGLDDAPLELSEEELEELDNDDPTAGLRIINLEPVTVGADKGVAELESLGIIEEVSSFTTNHACCQNRVTNIQRFADLMQGVVIRPDETISLNGHVGQRTREKGFVADGAINLGVLEPQVGGGISQYATTFFNASFFAGLEFIEYQSHSLYISRYPRGREATISWRRPDLKVKNTTPYGILIWNTYTPTSITVTFYSTKHLEVEALPLRRSSERQCRVDITPRVITFPDGTEVEDTVYAVYRPGEGLDCNGNSTRPEEPIPASTSTTDSAQATTTTTAATNTSGDDGIDDAITTTTAAAAGNGDA